MKPTEADLARDLAADLVQFDRRYGFNWVLWLCDNAEPMVPAAIRRAIAAEEEAFAVGVDHAGLHFRCTTLEAAIRQHRDERGDDRCHADDGRLYAVLPEGDTRPARETAVTIENCVKYIECRQTGREYVSPQRRIEELEAEVAELRKGTP